MNLIKETLLRRKYINFLAEQNWSRKNLKTWDFDELEKQYKSGKDLECIKHGFCPKCDAKDSFLEGPHGGMAINIVCWDCGNKWNLTPFGVEYIGMEATRALEAARKYGTARLVGDGKGNLWPL